jgi:hypothetical protein
MPCSRFNGRILQVYQSRSAFAEELQLGCRQQRFRIAKSSPIDPQSSSTLHKGDLRTVGQSRAKAKGRPHRPPAESGNEPAPDANASGAGNV